MSSEERTGIRSLVYSGWHRTGSLRRYLGIVTASRCCMIDIDACEYCCVCGEPLALIETQVSAAPPKRARVTERLAALAGIAAYSVSVQLDVSGEPTTFLVQQRVPSVCGVQAMNPRVYAYFLWALRENHVCDRVAA